jgi:hypothetical protein
LLRKAPIAKQRFTSGKEKKEAAQRESTTSYRKEKCILPIEVKSGHGSTLRSLHISLEAHPKSSFAIRFSSLNYAVIGKLDSRPLYAAAFFS